MELMEPSMTIKRTDGDEGPLYVVAIDGFDTVRVTADGLTRLLDLTGMSHCRELIDGPIGQVTADIQLDAHRFGMLDKLLAVYGQLLH